MRILVTNDDGVYAPGIEALARGLAADLATGDELVVVAPLLDHSGAGAAVGAVYERESIPFEPVDIPGLEHVPAYGIDGPPALAVILACIEGFGPRPDLVVSGVNNGANVGRSALHSGTVGAALTAAQFGLRGLAVSTTWSSDPVPWETPVTVASWLVPVVAHADEGTVLNLNVPSVPLDELPGIRHGRLSRTGLIRSARAGRPSPGQVDPVEPAVGPDAIRLVLRDNTAGAPPGATGDLDPDSDAGILAAGWASVTPLHGVHENRTAGGADALERALAEVDKRLP